jgi:hypothetical protein
MRRVVRDAYLSTIASRLSSAILGLADDIVSVAVSSPVSVVCTLRFSSAGAGAANLHQLISGGDRRRTSGANRHAFRRTSRAYLALRRHFGAPARIVDELVKPRESRIESDHCGGDLCRRLTAEWSCWRRGL